MGDISNGVIPTACSGLILSGCGSQGASTSGSRDSGGSPPATGSSEERPAKRPLLARVSAGLPRLGASRCRSQSCDCGSRDSEGRPHRQGTCMKEFISLLSLCIYIYICIYVYMYIHIYIYIYICMYMYIYIYIYMYLSLSLSLSLSLYIYIYI